MSLLLDLLMLGGQYDGGTPIVGAYCDRHIPSHRGVFRVPTPLRVGEDHAGREAPGTVRLTAVQVEHEDPRS